VKIAKTLNQQHAVAELSIPGISGEIVWARFTGGDWAAWHRGQAVTCPPKIGPVAVLAFGPIWEA